MQWSKLKKKIESNFAPSVSGRIEIKSTRYHNAHDQSGRGYITIDKEEIYNFCTITQMQEELKTSKEIREISGNTDYRNLKHKKGYSQSYTETKDILHKRGVFSQLEFYDSLQKFNSLSIEDSINSENLIIKSLAILDKRLGKRSLVKVSVATLDHPLLKTLYEFRCKVENIKVN